MAAYELEGPRWAKATLTWSFADPTRPNSSVFSATIQAAYQTTIRRAVVRWDNLVSMTLQEVPDTAADVDIRIGWSRFGINSNQIGEASYSYTTPEFTFVPGTLIRLEDPAERMLVGADPVYSGTQTGLYQVAVHELGHALGLDHSSDPAANMFPMSTTSNRDLNASDTAGIRALYSAPAFAMTNTVTSVSSNPDGTAYAGPVSYLDREFLYFGTEGIAVSSSIANVFIHAGSGDDAVAVHSGRNVLDGGQGSNFLVGGSGDDTFFVDGRGGQVTWGTLVNFDRGSSATLFGFDPAVSTRWWDGIAGAAGYTGPTLRADLQGGHVPSASITFANLTEADVARFQMSAGVVGGSAYLSVTNPL